MWEVIHYKSDINPKFRWVANILVFGDAHLEALGMVYESVGENVIPNILGGEGEVLVGVRFGKQEDLDFAVVVVEVSHEGSKDVGGHDITEGVFFEV